MKPGRVWGGLLVSLVTAVAAAADPAVVATLEKTDGTTVSGTLAAVSPTAVTLLGADPVAVTTVRRIVVEGPVARGPVVVECADGSTLSGNDFVWEGAAATVPLAGRGPQATPRRPTGGPCCRSRRRPICSWSASRRRGASGSTWSSARSPQ